MDESIDRYILYYMKWMRGVSERHDSIELCVDERLLTSLR